MAFVTKGLSSLSVEELCRKLRPVFGKQIDDLYMKYTISSDVEVRQEIEKALNALYHKYLNDSMLSEKILLEPPSEACITGDYPLGNIIYAERELYPFFMRDKDWIRHVCVCGMSGSGKTNFAFLVLGGFILKKKSFIVFDWKKSFRSLLDIDENLLCFPIGNENIRNFFRLNINTPPPGLGPKEWINILVDIISECYLTSFGVHKLLSEVLDEAFKDFGVYKGSGNYPTWLQIKDRLEEKAADATGRVSRETEWLASALRIAHSLTFGAFGDTINYKGKDLLSVSELLNHRVIFELDSLSNSEKKFFSEFILTYIYKLKKLNAESHTDEFRNAIIVDEAHNIFLKDRPNFLKESVTEMIYREVREYGISLICLDQHISKLSDVVAGNSACNIAFQQMLPQDIDTVSSLMQLIGNRKYFSMLPVGSAIVKLAERFHEPFMIKVPLIGIKSQTLDDKDVGSLMQARTREARQHKIFMERVRTENIVKELEHMDKVFKSSGVEPTDDFLKDQYMRTDELSRVAKEISRSMQDKQDSFEQRKQMLEEGKDLSQKSPHPLVNHLQLELVSLMRQLLSKGKNIDDIKKYLLSKGYKHKDILAAAANLKTSLVRESVDGSHQGSSSDIPVREYGSAGNRNSFAGNTTASRSRPVLGHRDLNVSDFKLKVLHYLNNRNSAVTQMYKHFSLSARKGTMLKLELEQDGLINVVEERTRAGWSKRLRLTEKGHALLSAHPEAGL